MPRGRLRLSPVDALNLAFLGLLCAALAVWWNRIPHRWTLAVLYPLIGAGVLLMARLRERRTLARFAALAQLLYPVAFLFGTFETFFMLLPFLNAARYDAELAAIDLAMLGVHPTVWLEHFFHPALTELLYVCYLLYFPLPLIPLIYLYRRARWRALSRAIFIFLVCYYGGYVGYALVPASGPRLHPEITALQTRPVQGLIATDPIRALIDVLEPNKLDAFPSLHMAILLTTLLVTYTVNRRMLAWFLPLAAGIVVSLVYLRYHYVVDVIAGAAWAAISYPLAASLFDRIAPKLAPHFAVESA